MNFLIFASLLVMLIHLGKLIWIWFKPAWLIKLGFGKPESRLMLTAYYLLSMLVLVAFVADQWGYIVFISGR